MKVVLLSHAEKQLRKLPKIDQIAVSHKIRTLQKPEFSGEEKLSGFSHIYRVRVGNYRVVYKKTKETLSIVIIRHRRDVYKIVKELLG